MERKGIRIVIIQGSVRPGNYTGKAAAWGTAWARVEAGKHYPSDVLASAALANFVAGFIQRAFISSPDISVSVTPEDGGLMSQFRLEF